MASSFNTVVYSVYQIGTNTPDVFIRLWAFSLSDHAWLVLKPT